MTAAEAVRARLLTLTPVTELVATRIWTFQLPQSVKRPAILVTQISDVQEQHLMGQGGVCRARVQVDAVALSIGAARAIDAAVLGTYADGAPTGLRGFAGDVDGSPAFVVLGCEALSARELYEAEDVKDCRVTRDYYVWYRE